MDDDIRDRFRSGRSTRPDPYGYGRPSRPAPRPVAPAPQVQPAPQPQSIPKQAPVPQPPRPVAPAPRPATPAPRPQPAPSSSPMADDVFELRPEAAKPKGKKRKKSKGGKGKRFFFIILALLVLGGLAYAGYWYYTNKYKNNDQAPASQQPSQASNAENKRTGTLRLVAVGDSLAFESLNNAAKKPDGSFDYAPMMSNFTPYFEKADVRVCNETTPGGGQTDGLSLSGYPTFNGPLGWNTSFAAAGCNVMNLASEHTNDKGQTAINNMLKSWSEQKNVLATAGANNSTDEQNTIRYVTAKDVKISYAGIIQY